MLSLMIGSLYLEHMAFSSFSVVMLHVLTSFFESFTLTIILPSRGNVSFISFFLFKLSSTEEETLSCFS